MKKNNKHTEIDMLSLERDIAEIAPLFDKIYDTQSIGVPADSVIDNIHAEAGRAQLHRKFEHKLHRVMRVAAAAAVLVLLMDGGMRINEHQENNRRQEVLNQLCIVASEDGALQEESADSSTEDIAQMLMEMQGLDENTYFAFN